VDRVDYPRRRIFVADPSTKRQRVGLSVEAFRAVGSVGDDRASTR